MLAVNKTHLIFSAFELLTPPPTPFPPCICRRWAVIENPCVATDRVFCWQIHTWTATGLCTQAGFKGKEASGTLTGWLLESFGWVDNHMQKTVQARALLIWKNTKSIQSRMKQKCCGVLHLRARIVSFFLNSLKQRFIILCIKSWLTGRKTEMRNEGNDPTVTLKNKTGITFCCRHSGRFGCILKVTKKGKMDSFIFWEHTAAQEHSAFNFNILKITKCFPVCQFHLILSEFCRQHWRLSAAEVSCVVLPLYFLQSLEKNKEFFRGTFLFVHSCSDTFSTSTITNAKT